MNLETLFSLCGGVAAAGWILLAVLPRWRYTATLVTGFIIPLCLALLYTVLVITEFGRSEGGFGSLAQVSLLFQNQKVLLAGWIHYLAFDLFIGSWEVRDAQRLGIHHLLVVPCLFFTFMFGPIGLLLYYGLRSVTKRRFLPEGA
jgi:chromate transport protein ChrA